uniref:U-box domain-containing protein n=1 Tax=Oryza meridionalis TaxID=40149 RepID=A0A0E0EVW1_9ORYZ
MRRMRRRTRASTAPPPQICRRRPPLPPPPPDAAAATTTTQPRHQQPPRCLAADAVVAASGGAGAWHADDRRPTNGERRPVGGGGGSGGCGGGSPIAAGIVVVGVGVPRARSSRQDPLLLVRVIVPLFPAGSRRDAVAGVLLLLRRRMDGASRACPALKLALPAMPHTRLTSASAIALVDGVVGVVADRPSAKAVKVALHMLYRLCPWSQNRVKAVDAGAVSTLMRLLLDEGCGGDRRACELTVVATTTFAATRRDAWRWWHTRWGSRRWRARRRGCPSRALRASCAHCTPWLMARHSATLAVLQEVQVSASGERTRARARWPACRHRCSLSARERDEEGKRKGKEIG